MKQASQKFRYNMTFWKRQNYGDRRAVVARGWGSGEGQIDTALRGFRSVKFLCMTAE